jgi:transcriptional regulator with XRE-family HTH domain
MPATPSPTARGRRLRHELRRLREQAGLTHSEVARRLEWSPSKVSRIETGQSRVQTGDVRDLLEVYGVTDQAAVEALVQLAREARRRGWWTRYTDVLGSGTYVGLETEATGLRTYESVFIPGLLQTEDYARAVIRAGQTKPDPETLDRGLSARMARQEILTRPDPPEIWAVLDESVINRPVGGPEVMRAQLKHLIELSSRPNTSVTLQILPLRIGAHPGMDGPFVILAFDSPTDPPMVYLETATDGLYLDEPADVERYTLMFNHLVARALGPDESRTMIAGLAERMA